MFNYNTQRNIIFVIYYMLISSVFLSLFTLPLLISQLKHAPPPRRGAGELSHTYSAYSGARHTPRMDLAKTPASSRAFVAFRLWRRAPRPTRGPGKNRALSVLFHPRCGFRSPSHNSRVLAGARPFLAPAAANICITPTQSQTPIHRSL